jgi:hypothetical protein
VFKGLRQRNLITLGVVSVIFVVCLSCLALNQQGSKRARTKRKTNAALTVQVTASRSLIKLPPATPDLLPLDCEPTENQVRLYANTTSPYKSAIKFAWQVPVGRLIGKDREVSWDLSGVQTGTYTATVAASDRHKHAGRGSTTVTVVVCPGWRPDPPPCPTISVSCPSFEAKGSATFVATVAGGDPETKLTYDWSLTAGRIISGQATSKITVDVSRLSQESITATVSVGGINPSCAKVASCTIIGR